VSRRVGLCSGIDIPMITELGQSPVSLQTIACLVSFIVFVYSLVESKTHITAVDGIMRKPLVDERDGRNSDGALTAGRLNDSPKTTNLLVDRYVNK